MFNRILVPIDMNNVEKLTKALDLAAQTAKQNDATVVYVGVVDAIPTTPEHAMGEKLKALLDDFAADQADTHGIKASDHIALRGDLHMNVGSDIIDAARQTNCDLIIMASHVPGIKEHIFSSNAGYVASHAPMSVYVVR